MYSDPDAFLKIRKQGALFHEKELYCPEIHQNELRELRGM
jgi:hypothetical protein